MLVLLGTLASTAACSPANKASTGSGTGSSVVETNPTCMNGVRDGDETGIDCGGSCATPCPGDVPASSGSGGSSGASSSGSSGASSSGSSGSSSGDAGADAGRDAGADAGSDAGVIVVGGIDGKKDGTETDIDCGGPAAPKCVEGQSCLVDSDCTIACSYAKKCVGAPSCTPHLGGDTCGTGEVGEPGAKHESCCRSLPVPGYADAAHPGKAVYLDKYEITAGRVRAFIERIAAANAGVPNVKGWVAAHRPQIWDPAWEAFLPSDAEGGTQLIGRRLLGDPRPEDEGIIGPPGPGVILPPATDQVRHMGTNFQFGSEIYVDLHGNDCATFADSYGFPTYYYPPDILARDGQLPRAGGVGANGLPIAAKDLLDVKSMNCVTNAMLTAFCQWDGGQLATDEVLDFVTATPASLGNLSGCGTQIDDHGLLLDNIFTGTIQSGGRCAPVALLNATFDAGDALPVLGSPLNTHNYSYPNTGFPTHDKAWQVAAPGRGSRASADGQATDVVRINAADEPWMDLNGNLSEAVLDVAGAAFTGTFGLKYRGIGYGSSRSDLNVSLIKGEAVLRIQRPEAKAAYMGGRCMRFR
jgi:hypothetical protein